jgi:RNA polymerase sigma-70 factor (ECF subfamily)
MDYSDKELIEMSVGGDSEAFSKLLDRYLQPVYSFALKITSNKDDAEDVAQEAFFKAWRNLKKYDPSYNFKSWIFTITHNCSIDLLRKRRNFVFSDLLNYIVKFHFLQFQINRKLKLNLLF